MTSLEVCRVCAKSTSGTVHHCREQMFGWGDHFAYFRCAECGCLQIIDVPRDLERFYPRYYYSFHLQPLPQHGVKSWLAAKRDLFAVTGRGLTGRLIESIRPARTDVACLRPLMPTRKQRILDLGCGRGELLSILYRAGFHDLMGIDPHLPGNVSPLPGLQVYKLELGAVLERFDIIMLHHVFEHLDLPLKTLRECVERLKPGGRILLRFPTVDSDAWERYRENWVQLDAPRHLFLHSRRSVSIIAERAGLEVRKWWCDSTAFQFWGSELYEKRIPLYDTAGKAALPDQHFTLRQMRQFAKAAQIANGLGRGDQVAVVLTVADDSQHHRSSIRCE